MSRDTKYIGMDVHKEAIVIAVLNYPPPHVAIRTTPCTCFRPWPSLVWRERRPRARYAR
jgi:hypothetical protein